MLSDSWLDVVVQNGICDEKTTEAGAPSKNVKTFEQLMAELAELESRIQQSADQSASVRVIIFDGFVVFCFTKRDMEMEGLIVIFGN